MKQLKTKAYDAFKTLVYRLAIAVKTNAPKIWCGTFQNNKHKQ